ncbi:trichothecene efflux pump [Colletotrichum tofieldiae]|nr:trichothecene efflux pump [Colletotrichum tofieldiae]
MDGAVRQIQIQILGDPVHWFNKTFGFIMVVSSMNTTETVQLFIRTDWYRLKIWEVPLLAWDGSLLRAASLPESDRRLSTMWLMGSSIGFLLVGRLSDLYGRRYFIVGTSFLGVIGSILGCFGGSTSVLMAANVLSGIAAAAQMSFGFVIGELVPTKWRAP